MEGSFITRINNSGRTVVWSLSLWTFRHNTSNTRFAGKHKYKHWLVKGSWKQCHLPWLSQHWQRGRFAAYHTKRRNSLNVQTPSIMPKTITGGQLWLLVQSILPVTTTSQLVFNSVCNHNSSHGLGTAYPRLAIFDVCIPFDSCVIIVIAEYS